MRYDSIIRKRGTFAIILFTGRHDVGRPSFFVWIPAHSPFALILLPLLVSLIPLRLR